MTIEFQNNTIEMQARYRKQSCHETSSQFHSCCMGSEASTPEYHFFAFIPFQKLFAFVLEMPQLKSGWLRSGLQLCISNLKKQLFQLIHNVYVLQ